MNSIAPPPKALFRVPLAEAGPRPTPLRVVPLSETLSAAYFDGTEELTVHGAELVGTTGSEALERPLITTQLARSEAGSRNLFLLSRSARSLCRDGLEICHDGYPVAAIDPMTLQSPIVDPLALMTGLSPEGGRRLLKLLLTTGLSLFGQKAFEGFRDIVTQLLASLTPSTLRLQAWCPIAATACVASYALPRNADANGFTELVLLEAGQVQRVSGFAVDLETTPDGERLMHLTLPLVLQPGAMLVALSDTPIRLAGPETAQSARPLGPWLERRSGPIRRRVRSKLQDLARRDTTAAALLDEIACPPADRPQAIARFLASTPDGLFYAISLRDPRDLLQRMVIGTHGANCSIPVGRPLHHPRFGPLQVGFLRGNTEAISDGSTELSLHYRTGRLSHAGPVEIKPLSEGLPDALIATLEDLPAQYVYGALAQAYSEALVLRRPARAERIAVHDGAQTASCCLVVEVGGSLDYPHALMTALRGARNICVLLHHADPAATPLLMRLAEEIHAVHGVETAVAAQTAADLHPSERLRAVLASVTTPNCILLAEDALPLGSEWLVRWMARLTEDGSPQLAGGILLNHDNTIRHSGGRVSVDGTAAPLQGDLNYKDLVARGVRALESDLFSASCLGLNAPARALLANLPLRTPGADGDLSRLAQSVRKATGVATIHTDLALAAHAIPKTTPHVVQRAENSIIHRSRA